MVNQMVNQMGSQMNNQTENNIEGCKDLIIGEMIKILKNQFPTNVELLSIMGSYNDTMPDWEIYQMLYDWRTTGTAFKSISCEIK